MARRHKLPFVRVTRGKEGATPSNPIFVMLHSRMRFKIVFTSATRGTTTAGSSAHSVLRPDLLAFNPPQCSAEDDFGCLKK